VRSRAHTIKLGLGESFFRGTERDASIHSDWDLVHPFCLATFFFPASAPVSSPLSLRFVLCKTERERERDCWDNDGLWVSKQRDGRRVREARHQDEPSKVRPVIVEAYLLFLSTRVSRPVFGRAIILCRSKLAGLPWTTTPTSLPRW
jgi:hypothetical protein